MSDDRHYEDEQNYSDLASDFHLGKATKKQLEELSDGLFRLVRRTEFTDVLNTPLKACDGVAKQFSLPNEQQEMGGGKLVYAAKEREQLRKNMQTAIGRARIEELVIALYDRFLIGPDAHVDGEEFLFTDEGELWEHIFNVVDRDAR
jgi:hypothetical protein